MATSNFVFPASALNTVTSISGAAPHTLTFHPSAISIGANNFLGTITYSVLSSTGPIVPIAITNTFTYNTLASLGAGTMPTNDSRYPYSHTFYNVPVGSSITRMIVSAVAFPSKTIYVYPLDIYATMPYIAQNPYDSVPDTSVFNKVHLIKSRSWGSSNQQVIVAEGIASTGAGQVILFTNESPDYDPTDLFITLSTAELIASCDSAGTYCNTTTTGSVVATVTNGTAPYSYSWVSSYGYVVPNNANSSTTDFSTTIICGATFAVPVTLTVTDSMGNVGTTNITVNLLDTYQGNCA